MRVIFYIATSINGCIAAADGTTNWSAEDNAGYLEISRRIGAVVIGRKTYDELLTLPDNDWPCPAGHTVVLSSNQDLKSAKSFSIFFTPNGPHGAISILEKLGKPELVVIGGNQTWTSFMQVNLIDEIYLDIEPVALGNGIHLFSGAEFETKLELISTKPLSPQTLQLHYLIKK